MNLEHHNPASIHPPGPYSHAVVVNQGRLAYLSGQVAFNQAGELVGEGDLDAQLHQVFKNIGNILTDLQADFLQVVKVTIFVAEYSPDKVGIIRNVLYEHFPEGNRPASTLIGVQSLALGGLLVEVEAVVALRD